MRLAVACLLVAAALVASVPAAAQTRAESITTDQPASVRRPGPKPKRGVDFYGAADFDSLAASQSFNAVLNKHKLWGYGAGLDVTNVWKRVFARVAVSYTSQVGSRAFVANGTVFSLHIPLTVVMAPVEIATGWRFAPIGKRGRYSVYVGGGLLLLRYDETSQFATSGDNVAKSLYGVTALGGMDVGITKHLIAGVEAQYRHVSSGAGVGGLSADFGEHDLGGFTARILFGLRR
jgi:hypothetical protein